MAVAFPCDVISHASTCSSAGSRPAAGPSGARATRHRQILLASGGALLGRLLTGVRGCPAMAVLGNSVILLLAVRLGWTAMAS
ncbi:hypothetical protein AB0B15_25715 [Streptomyces sp. NPDC045456]|uniref:hypothetical protein n=1 Tax=Streptomyces sp. NPDC045456 TaxID=3155254 RepID=UPI0034100469